MPPPPTARTEASIVIVGNQIYVIGGFTPDGISDKVEVFDLTRKIWSERSPLPRALHHTTASVVKNKIYVIGGFESGFWIPVAFTFQYDPKTNIWNEKNPMPTPRGALASGVIENKIHVIGGVKQNLYRLINTPAHEVYDPNSDNWGTLNPMLTPRDHLTVATVDGILYAIGGRVNTNYNNNLNINESFDVMTNKWSKKAYLPTARSGITSQVLDRKIFVLGGGSSEKAFNENEAYDPKNDTWEIMEPMKKGYHGLGSAVYMGNLYLLTGGPSPGAGGSKFHNVFRLTR